LVEKKNHDEAEYKRRVQSVFDLLTGAGLIIALGGVLLAPWIIPLVFGAKYEAAIPILIIQCLATPFAFSGSVRGLFFVMENLNQYHIASAILGIAANVCTAILLMPHLGARGAAVGAVVGYAFSSVISSWFFAKVHPCARYQTRSLFILFRIPSAYAEVRRFL
jgi:O-antigen/teichoic acid export membrane protein